MRILFDHNVPEPLRDHLAEHDVHTADERGWAEVSNGELLDQAETAGYELLITADQNMRHQQVLSRRQIAFVLLRSNRWPIVQPWVEDIRAAIEGLQPGELRKVPN